MARAAQTASRPSLKMQDFMAGVAKDAMKAANATTRTVYMVPLENIEVAPGFNLRVTDTKEYQDGIQELKRSILQEGFYQTKPLAGYVAKNKDGQDTIYVTDGHRRLEAAKLAASEGAELERLPMIVRPAAASTTDLTVALHRENTGMPLSMLEKAVLVKRLLNSGMTEVEVAEKMDFTTRYISDLLVLIEAPKEIRALVAAGKVSGTEAVKQLRKNKDAAVEKLQALAEKAEGTGRSRVTAQDVSGGRGDEGVKMKTYKREVGVKKGETVKIEEFQPIIDLFGYQDLFAPTNRAGRIKAKMDFTVLAKIRRPVVEEAEPAAEEQDEAAAEGNGAAEPTKRGRKARKQEDEAEPVGREVDPMTMQEGAGEGEGADVADLRERGIADPAADL